MHIASSPFRHLGKGVKDIQIIAGPHGEGEGAQGSQEFYNRAQVPRLCEYEEYHQGNEAED